MDTYIKIFEGNSAEEVAEAANEYSKLIGDKIISANTAICPGFNDPYSLTVVFEDKFEVKKEE